MEVEFQKEVELFNVPSIPVIGMMKEFQNVFKFVNFSSIPLLGIPRFKSRKKLLEFQKIFNHLPNLIENGPLRERSL